MLSAESAAGRFPGFAASGEIMMTTCRNPLRGVGKNQSAEACAPVTITQGWLGSKKMQKGGE